MASQSLLVKSGLGTYWVASFLFLQIKLFCFSGGLVSQARTSVGQEEGSPPMGGSGPFFWTEQPMGLVRA